MIGVIVDLNVVAVVAVVAVVVDVVVVAAAFVAVEFLEQWLRHQ